MISIRVFPWILVFILLADLIITSHGQYTAYHFKRYPFKKKQKNERKIKSVRGQCEGDKACEGLFGAELLNCVRRCMSPKCYEEIYEDDPLEEGEIDVRYNSFKGCIITNTR